MTPHSTQHKKFTVKATFWKRGAPAKPAHEYVCTVEPGSTECVFTLEISGTGASTFSKREKLDCAPSVLEREVFECLTLSLHTDHSLVLSAFQPEAEWKALVGPDAVQDFQKCSKCHELAKGGSQYCAECRGKYCVSCDQNNDRAPYPYCSRSACR